MHKAGNQMFSVEIKPAWNVPVPHTHFTFAVHPHLQTLEQAAVLAAVALLPRHLAVLVTAAAVHALITDTAFEEALAAFTGDDAIVQACGAISTDKASTLVSWIICIRKECKKASEKMYVRACLSVCTVIHPDFYKKEEKKALRQIFFSFFKLSSWGRLGLK